MPCACSLDSTGATVPHPPGSGRGRQHAQTTPRALAPFVFPREGSTLRSSLLHQVLTSKENVLSGSPCLMGQSVQNPLLPHLKGDWFCDWRLMLPLLCFSNSAFSWKSESWTIAFQLSDQLKKRLLFSLMF